MNQLINAYLGAAIIDAYDYETWWRHHEEQGETGQLEYVIHMLEELGPAVHDAAGTIDTVELCYEVLPELVDWYWATRIDGRLMNDTRTPAQWLAEECAARALPYDAQLKTVGEAREYLTNTAITWDHLQRAAEVPEAAEVAQDLLTNNGLGQREYNLKHDISCHDYITNALECGNSISPAECLALANALHQTA